MPPGTVHTPSHTTTHVLKVSLVVGIEQLCAVTNKVFSLALVLIFRKMTDSNVHSHKLPTTLLTVIS